MTQTKNTALLQENFLKAMKKRSSFGIIRLVKEIHTRSKLKNNYNWNHTEENEAINYWNNVRIWSFSGPYFPTLGLNTGIYRLHLRI